METAEFPTPTDPVILAGLARHAIAPDQLSWTVIDEQCETTILARGGGPRIEIVGAYSWMSWMHDRRHRIRYERREGEHALHQITISDYEISDATGIGITDRPLSTVIDVPGGDNLVIAGVHVESLGEFRNTVISLRTSEG